MTPTSATGAEARAAGFTLVEMLVVLVIVGLLGTAVLLTAPVGQDPLVQASERLGAQLVRARDEAILGARAVEVTLDARGYGFAVERLDGSQPLQVRPLQDTAWPDAVALLLPRGTERAIVRFDPIGAAEPATLLLTSDGRRARIDVDGAGAVHVAPPAG